MNELKNIRKIENMNLEELKLLRTKIEKTINSYHEEKYNKNSYSILKLKSLADKKLSENGTNWIENNSEELTEYYKNLDVFQEKILFFKDRYKENLGEILLESIYNKIIDIKLVNIENRVLFCDNKKKISKLTDDFDRILLRNEERIFKELGEIASKLYAEDIITIEEINSIRTIESDLYNYRLHSFGKDYDNLTIQKITIKKEDEIYNSSTVTKYQFYMELNDKLEKLIIEKVQ